MFKRNLDITNALLIIAVFGYGFTGVLTFIGKADVKDFNGLTQDVLLAVIAFGKAENQAENERKDD